MSIGVGIVGYGAQFSMGKHHCDAVAATESLHVSAIYDKEPVRREAAREEQPAVAICKTWEELLARNDVQLVVLVTPHDTHAPLSVQASKAGKHVMTEKVMCLDTAECDAMIAAAKDAGKMLTVYQNRRWDADYLTVRKHLPELGRLFQIESSVNGWWFPDGWRGIKKHGGGMLYDWGAHLADQIVQIMLPAKPTTVFATSYHGVHKVDTETQATVSITFDNGVAAQIDVGCISHLARPRWLIRGEQGALLMPDWEHCQIKTAKNDSPRDISLEPANWQECYNNVSRHLNLGEELAIKPEECRIAISILDAAFKSAESGKAVSIVDASK